MILSSVDKGLMSMIRCAVRGLCDENQLDNSIRLELIIRINKSTGDIGINSRRIAGVYLCTSRSQTFC